MREIFLILVGGELFSDRVGKRLTGPADSCQLVGLRMRRRGLVKRRTNAVDQGVYLMGVMTYGGKSPARPPCCES